MENPRLRKVNDASKERPLPRHGGGLPGRPFCSPSHPVPIFQWFSGSSLPGLGLGDSSGAWVLTQYSSVPFPRQSRSYFLFCFTGTGSPTQCGFEQNVSRAQPQRPPGTPLSRGCGNGTSISPCAVLGGFSVLHSSRASWTPSLPGGWPWALLQVQRATL